MCTLKCEETKPVFKSGLNAVEKERYKKALTRIQEGKKSVIVVGISKYNMKQKKKYLLWKINAHISV